MSRQYRGGHASTADQAEAPVDLENQFIMRFPPEAAAALKEALQTEGGNLRERLSIKLEPDKTVANQSHLRRGVVKFDNWELSAKLVDLPTIIESQKTIDRKTFYKTADICQLLICKEGEPSEDEEEPPEKAKKQNLPNKDPSKVEKKYLYPHGISAPLKNVRKRRFRKVLRKNYVEAPEIEKEVKHLLRVDNEAVDVKWELITEEELNAGKSTENATSVPTLANVSGLSLGEETAIDESDLFGALSESDEENIDVDSEGEMYNDDNDPSSSNAVPATNSGAGPLVTEFRKEMFQDSSQQEGHDEASPDEDEDNQPGGGAGGENAVAIKLEKLRGEISQLQRQREELQHNINNCDNQALLQRFRDSLYKVEADIRLREMDIESFSMFS